MASIDCKFFSETLGMASSMRVLLPEPSARLRHPSVGAAAEPFFRETAHLARRMLAALPLQRSLIQHIHAHGLPRD